MPINNPLPEDLQGVPDTTDFNFGNTPFGRSPWGNGLPSGFPGFPGSIPDIGGPYLDGSGIEQSPVDNSTYQNPTAPVPPEAVTPNINLNDLRPDGFTPEQAVPGEVSGLLSAGANTSVNSGASVSGGGVARGQNVNTNPNTNITGDLNITGDIDYETYQAIERELSDEAKSSYILNEITSQDSPLMQRAKQEGILMAGRRGLQNSSIAAGTAMGAMVDRATPLAIQDSQAMTSMELANLENANRSLIFNAAAANAAELTGAQLKSNEGLTAAQLRSNENLAGAQIRSSEALGSAQLRSNESIAGAQIASNASIASAQIRSNEAQLSAQLAVQQQQFNANWANQAAMLNAELNQQASQFNASQNNMINTRIMELNSALNMQYLSGTQALDLATIQGQYGALISQNQMAGDLFTTYMQSIGIMMANENIDPGRVAVSVQTQLNMLNQGLDFINQMQTFMPPGQTVGNSGPAPLQQAGGPSFNTAPAPAPLQQAGGAGNYTQAPPGYQPSARDLL